MKQAVRFSLRNLCSVAVIINVFFFSTRWEMTTVSCVSPSSLNLCPSTWLIILCFIYVLHTFPLSSHLSGSTSRTHFILFTFSTYSNYTFSLSLISAALHLPLLSGFTVASSHILSLLPHLAFYVPFLLPSIIPKKKKSPVSHWWLHMLWSFCFQKGAFLSPTPPPGQRASARVSLVPNESESESIR